MTNQKAIEILKNWNRDLALMKDEAEGIECHDLAIAALEKQISKEKAINKVIEQMEEYIKESKNVDYNGAMIEAIEIVKSGGIE